MNGEQRRQAIISRLEKSDKPVSATKLAKEFSVTRQIIVADIALLRAGGQSIRAEHYGYVLGSATKVDGILKRIVVKHGKDSVQEEFYAIVDNGGKVIDVIIEHSIYGMISVKLDIATRYDADTFVSNINGTGARPISVLTEGLHIHTVCVPNEQSFDRIVDKLKDLNIYIESN